MILVDHEVLDSDISFLILWIHNTIELFKYGKATSITRIREVKNKQFYLDTQSLFAAQYYYIIQLPLHSVQLCENVCTSRKIDMNFLSRTANIYVASYISSIPRPYTHYTMCRDSMPVGFHMHPSTTHTHTLIYTLIYSIGRDI